LRRQTIVTVKAASKGEFLTLSNCRAHLKAPIFLKLPPGKYIPA
jgi:hypothetical protein